MADLSDRRVLKSLARQDYEKQMVADRGVQADTGLNSAGPPAWSRQAWENFRTQNGFYPFGMQGGGLVLPPTFRGAPDWVYELMGMRKPPVEVGG